MAANGGTKRYIGLIIVVVLALLSWWFQHQEGAQKVSQQGDTHLVDYTMRDFEVTAMDDAGQPRHHLQAVLMRHYQDDDSAELEQPQLLLYHSKERSADERWSLRAERAQLYHGGAEVLLQGGVQMRRLNAADQVTLELDTRELWVYPDQQRAESAEQVEIRESHGVTRAQGLKMNIKEGWFDLLATVRGEYVLEQ